MRRHAGTPCAAAPAPAPTSLAAQLGSPAGAVVGAGATARPDHRDGRARGPEPHAVPSTHGTSGRTAVAAHAAARLTMASHTCLTLYNSSFFCLGAAACG